MDQPINGPTPDTGARPKDASGGDAASDPDRDSAASANDTASRRASRPAQRPGAGRRQARRRRSRTSFGNVRALPSGRFQARYTDARNERHTAPLTFRTRREAEDYLAGIRVDMLRGRWRPPELGAITLADYAGQLVAARVDLAPKTRELYEGLLRLWILPPHRLPAAYGRRARTVELGTTSLNALDIVVIRDWYAAAIHTTDQRAAQRTDEQAARARRRVLEEVHPARAWARAQGLDVARTGRIPAAVLAAWEAAGRPVGTNQTGRRRGAVNAALPVTGRLNPPGHARVAQAYRYLKTILQQAVRDGRMDANPCQLPSGGLVRSRERVPACAEEVDALAAAMPPRWSAAVQVAAWSGLRAGELFGLARRHVDLDEGTVRVERAVTYLPNAEPFLGPTKTESSRRTVHLPPHVVTILRDHMDRFTRPGRDALVFADERGRIASTKVRTKNFQRARRAVGRPDLTWHDLRHTGATIAARAGASLRELQHRFGHSTVRAAMIYQHADHQRDRELALAMSALVRPVSGNVIEMHGRDAAG